ncbi:MAG: hypothetical protein EOM20_09035 [Spartobacteria bacterium]|nr:hypothetical protein [Spartobacteria bacterium]
MAMMITKFHKLIQSRVIWGIILVLIVIAFVGLYIRWPGQDERDQEAASAGQLNGEHIHWQEFSNARVNTYLSLVMMMGRQLNITKELDKHLDDAAWKRLANMRKAAEMGLMATDKEVVGAIQNYPVFMHEGRYHRDMYNQFVNGFLRNLGISEVQFEQYIREEIALQKLRNMVGQLVMVSPYELQRTFGMLTDTFDVEYAIVTTNSVKDKVSVTEEDAKLYFDEDPERFTIPEKVVVRYIEIPLSDFMESEPVTEEDALVYYDENLDEFTETVMVTNTPIYDFNSETTPEPIVTEEEKTLAFEDVQDQINEILLRAKAREKAVDVATDIAIALTPDRAGKVPSLEKIAEQYELDVQSVGPFGYQEELEDMDNPERVFNRAAFELRANPDECYTDAVEGDNVVYIIYLDERQEPRVPDYEEVADLVKEEAELDAMSQALVDEAKDLREDALEKLEAGESFASVVESYGLEVETMTNLNAAATMGEEDEDALAFLQDILRAVLVQNQGEVTELIPLEDSIMVAHVAKRQLGDSTQYTAFRPQITATIKRDRARNLFGEWEDYLLAAGQFTPRKTADSSPGDDEVIEEEEEEDLDLMEDEAPDDEPQDDEEAAEEKAS